MENQHAKIRGYRDLNQSEIDMTNHLKQIEANLGIILNTIDAGCKKDDPEAGRWAAIARTNLETGFMYAIKAVVRPTNGLGRRIPDNRTQEEIERDNQAQTDSSN